MHQSKVHKGHSTLISTLFPLPPKIEIILSHLTLHPKKIKASCSLLCPRFEACHFKPLFSGIQTHNWGHQGWSYKLNLELCISLRSVVTDGQLNLTPVQWPM